MEHQISMKTEKELAEQKAKFETELQSIHEAHKTDSAAFENVKANYVQVSQQRQLRVTHLEGRIAQLKELLPEQPAEKPSES